MSNTTLPGVWFDGCYRVLACTPETPESVAAFPSFGSAFMGAGPVEPQEIDLTWYGTDILNQLATSSCMGHAVGTGLEYGWMQGGRPKKNFNPYFTYGLCNGGRDQGSMISDGLKVSMQYGICEREALPRGVMYQNQFPRSAFDNASRFKLAQAFRCDTFEDILRAISLGFPVPLGIMVGNNFPNLDSDGVAPLPGGGGGGHAILGVGTKKHRRYGWLVKIQNSWGKNFGMNGFAYLHAGHFRYMRPDAFAIQSMADDPQDSTPADEVPVATN